MWSKEIEYRLAQLRSLYLELDGKVSKEIKDEMIKLHEWEHEEDLRRFGNTLGHITRRLYFHDPIELVQCQIPQEEYDIEARMILRELAIRGRPDLKEITDVVYQIFLMQFGPTSVGTIDRPCYDLIAKELLEITDEWCGK